MKKPIDVQKVIAIHMIISGANTKGWVHTHGMEAFGRPELEIVGLPLFMAKDAGVLLNEVCDYFLNGGKVIKVGETMQLGRHAIFKFVKSTPLNPDDADEIETHYKAERWRLVDP